MTHWDYELPSGHTALMIADRLVKSDRYDGFIFMGPPCSLTDILLNECVSGGQLNVRARRQHCIPKSGSSSSL